MNELIVLIIPLLGTTLGSAMVFFMRNTMNIKIEKSLLGFASGVMVAASIWSLLIPAIDMAKEQNIIAWIPAVTGFMLGILFLLAIDSMFAVTIHNIPEGMAVGVAYAGAVAGKTGISVTAALALSIGIAIQNFPEGAIISMPLKSEGMSKSKAFGCGFLSGIVEPIGAFITVLLTAKIVVVLPYILAFAAGAMMYVVVEELIPESQSGEHTNIGTIGFAIGFALMMVLDVALG